MCEFILIVFIAVSVLMPKLCFRQRLLKLWSPCKKHPWNESHFTFKSVCSKCKYSLISWEQSRRCKCLPQYCNSYIRYPFFTRKKTSAASVVLKKILNSVSWKWKLAEDIDTSVSVCPPGGAKAPVVAALILCYRCSWKTSHASLCCVFNMQLKTKSGLRGQTVGNVLLVRKKQKLHFSPSLSQSEAAHDLHLYCMLLIEFSYLGLDLNKGHIIGLTTLQQHLCFFSSFLTWECGSASPCLPVC